MNDTLIHIRGGRVIDPQRGFDDVADVYIADGRIAADGTKAEVMPTLSQQQPMVCDVLTEKL